METAQQTQRQIERTRMLTRLNVAQIKASNDIDELRRIQKVLWGVTLARPWSDMEARQYTETCRRLFILRGFI